MQIPDRKLNPLPSPLPHWICPDLREYWTLAQLRESDRVVLKAIQGDVQLSFSPTEGYALRYFVGQYTVQQVQDAILEGSASRRAQQFPNADPNLVVQLLQKLIAAGILTFEAGDLPPPTAAETHPTCQPFLKLCVEWVEHPDCWILRNPEDVTFLQVSDRDKTIIDRLGQIPTSAIVREFGISPGELKHLLQLLAATGMLQGTTPAKPKRGKITPLKLLYFRVPLFNPDRILTRSIQYLHWIWTKTVASILIVFLMAMASAGADRRAEILFAGQQLINAYGASLILPFALLSACVVTLHELGHAFTLKHYGGIVPEIGLLFMCLIPSAYTNTSDSYCLSRWQRVLVVGAGILVQLIIAAIALLLWHLTTDGTWLKTACLLLLAASLFTIALNLNPLSKFDGYYLAVALTGINNLRSRAFGFYRNLLQGKPIEETQHDALILAAYAPFSLAYLWFVFGFLFWRIVDWTLVNIPTIAGILFILMLMNLYKLMVQFAAKIYGMPKLKKRSSKPKFNSDKV